MMISSLYFVCCLVVAAIVAPGVESCPYLASLHQQQQQEQQQQPVDDSQSADVSSHNNTLLGLWDMYKHRKPTRTTTSQPKQQHPMIRNGTSSSSSSSRSLQVTISSRVADLDSLVIDIFNTILENPGQFIPGFVQLAFLDCMGGICDGCVPRGTSSTSGAVAASVTALQRFVTKYGGWSRADVWAVAALTATQLGARLDPFTTTQFALTGLGRTDCHPSNAFMGSEEPDLMHATTGQLLQFMRQRFGFSAQETVAIMGAHTLGKVSTAGIAGSWTLAPDFLNNEYYRNLMQTNGMPRSTFQQRSTLDGSDFFWSNTPTTTVALGVDMALLVDVAGFVNPTTGQVSCSLTQQTTSTTTRCPTATSTASIALQFAQDDTVWMNAFDNAFTKMVSNGYMCSGSSSNGICALMTVPPTPAPTPAPTTPVNVQAVASGIQQAIADITTIIMDNTSINMNAKLFRLFFHDCVGGICDGCVDLTEMDNFGLDRPISLLQPLEAKYAGVLTRADLWMLAAFTAANVAQRPADGIGIPFDFSWFGRESCPNPTRGPHRGMPTNHFTTQELLDFFAANWGLSTEQTVALMGGHTLGRAVPSNSGFDGQQGWVRSPFVLNSDFFRLLMTAGGTVETAFVQELQNNINNPFPNQFMWRIGTPPTGPFMLNVDMALAVNFDGFMDPATGEVSCSLGIDPSGRLPTCPRATQTAGFAQRFARSESRFLTVLRGAMQQIANHGYRVTSQNPCTPQSPCRLVRV